MNPRATQSPVARILGAASPCTAGRASLSHSFHAHHFAHARSNVSVG